FQPGEDVNYIAVTATLSSPSIVLHEYVHFLLRENVGGLPLWISEGFAECYSTFELGSKQNEFSIGRAPERHITTLNETATLTPLKRLLPIQQNSPEYNEESKQGLFYAESWAFVHYLILGAEGESEFYLGDLLLHLNRLADADAHLTGAVSKAPALSAAQTSLALLRVRQKKYDEALALLKKAADTDSKNPMISFYYAYVLERA